MSGHDEALVSDLVRVIAVTLGWDWIAVPEERIPSAVEVITDDVVVPILDRLAELGMLGQVGPCASKKPAMTGMTGSPDVYLSCERHKGHAGPHSLMGMAWGQL